MRNIPLCDFLTVVNSRLFYLNVQYIRVFFQNNINLILLKVLFLTHAIHSFSYTRAVLRTFSLLSISTRIKIHPIIIHLHFEVRWLIFDDKIIICWLPQ